MVGRDDTGEVVVVLGICTTDRWVTMDVTVPRKTLERDYSAEGGDWAHERTRLYVQGDVGRAVLQRLPDTGYVDVGATVLVRAWPPGTAAPVSEGNDHFIQGVTLDLAAVPTLPDDADDLARSYCR